MEWPQQQEEDYTCSVYGSTLQPVMVTHPPIAVASAQGNMGMLTELLSQNVDILEEGEHQFTALHVAATNGYIGVAKLLLRYRADIIDVDSRDMDGCTPLIHAAQYGHRAMVNLLLHARASLEASDLFGNTAATLAFCRGHTNIGKYLVSLNSSCISEKSLHIALTCASRDGHLETVLHLVEMGVDTQKVDSNGDTAMLLAFSHGHQEVGEVLFNVNPQGIHLRNAFGWNALMGACQNGHFECVKFLVAKGVKVNKRAYGGQSAVMLALSVGHCKIGQYLVRHGATGLNDCDMDGWTALLYASRDGHFSAVTYLIKKQVDINQCADYGISALYLAIQTGHENIASYLIKHGAHVNTQCSDGKTLLMVAIRRGCNQIVRELLSHNMTINVRDTDGNTALHHVTNHGNYDIIECLLKKGADINLKNNQLQTVKQVTNDETLRELLSHYGELQDKGDGALRQSVGVSDITEETSCQAISKQPENEIARECFKGEETTDAGEDVLNESKDERVVDLKSFEKVSPGKPEGLIYSENLSGENYEEIKFLNMDTVSRMDGISDDAVRVTVVGSEKINKEKMAKTDIMTAKKLSWLSKVPSETQIPGKNTDALVGMEAVANGEKRATGQPDEHVEDTYSFCNQYMGKQLLDLQNKIDELTHNINVKHKRSDHQVRELGNIVRSLKEINICQNMEFQKAFELLFKKNEDSRTILHSEQGLNDLVFHKIFYCIAQAVGSTAGLWRSLCTNLLLHYPQFAVESIQREIEQSVSNDFSRAYESLVRWKVIAASLHNKEEVLKRVVSKLDLPFRENICSKIDAIVADHMISCSQEDRAGFLLDDKNLNDLAKEIGNEWLDIGINLDIPHPRLCHLDYNNKNDAQKRNLDMLVDWRNREGGPHHLTVMKLCQAFIMAGRADLSEKIGHHPYYRQQLTK